MRTYECHVYFDRSRNQLNAFCGPPSWVGPDHELVGTFEFTHATEPTRTSILEWALPMLRMLDIPHKDNGLLQVINYATQAYWGRG